jgi:poly(A) polymerase
MKNFLDKIFFRSNNLDFISKDIKDLTKNTTANKIFDAINLYSPESEIRYVGGCIRKIINKEKVDDIDFATNLEPKQVCEALKKNDISYFESGIDHGTITALDDEFKFEITSLRKDIFTDGRHAKVEFSKDWKEDASRRDFTINSIYSDKDGNLFDPHNGKKDLENGKVNFIGLTDKRIKEDFLRILRYVRFFLNYSKQPHDPEVVKKLKMNIQGISKLSKERLLDELKKIAKIETLQKLSKDKISLEIILLIFPELKNIKIFSKLNESNKNFLKRNDFIFLISLMIVDETDNVDYFLYKFNISTKNKKRIKNIDNFYKEKISSKTFNENNMNKYFYYYGREATLDILNFKLVKLNKVDKSLTELVKYYENKEALIMPVKADFLMKKYEIPEGKLIGEKLKRIEEEWVKNNFKISDQEVDSIVNN